MEILLLVIWVTFIVVSTTKLKLHPFLALIIAALGFGLSAGIDSSSILLSIKDGFGSTLGNIGLVIILGVIIGAFLEHSGGVYSLAERILRFIGPKRIITAMGIVGFLVSIPVFADSGFVILSSLNRALSKRVGISLAGPTVGLAVGLMSSHVLIPPTPGPIAVAGILGADLGMVIFWGFVVSLFGLSGGLIFANKVASKTYIDPAPDIDEAALHAKIAQAPGVSKSAMPILIPILLIVAKSFNDYLQVLTGPVEQVIAFIGHPVIALLIGLLFALRLPSKLDQSMLSVDGWTGEALKDAAIILMITGAGGVFGKVLQASSLADLISTSLSGAGLGLLLPFLIAAALKSAQGSSTVAMITTASIVAPLLDALGLSSDLSTTFTVLAIGAGSSVVSHVNDSFFWIVTQMTGMSVSTGYRLQTVSTALFGIICISVLLILQLLIV